MKRLYVPLDVTLADDPKILEAGPDAEQLYVRALMLAKRSGSDGVIHQRSIARLAGDLTAVRLGETTGDQLAKELVRVGLWEDHHTGYQIVAWLEWNPPQAELDEKKAKERERKKNYRKGGNTASSNGSGQVVEVVPPDATRLSHRTSGGTDTGRPAEIQRTSAVFPDVEIELDTDTDTEDLRPLVRFDYVESDDPLEAAIQAIFDYWLMRTGRTRRTRLDTRRRNRILWALDHYPEVDVLAAIDGCADSSWHQGHNPHGRRYDDLTLILRDATHLEGFRDAVHGTPIPPGFGVLIADHQEHTR